MAESTGSSALVELSSIVSSTIALVKQLEDVLADILTREEGAKQSGGDSKPNALSLAHDSSSLIKAHSTKISLLIINEPFTPTAITKVLRELVAGPLPALLSAVEVCDASRYTRVLRLDLAWKCSRVLKEFRNLVQLIPSDGKILVTSKKNGSGQNGAGKGSLPVTGLLWAACDDVVALSKLGVAGHLIRKVEQFRDTLKDITEELKEWGDEADDEDDDDDDDADGEGAEVTPGGESDDVAQATNSLEATHISSTQDMLDDFMNSQQHIPRDDPDRIRERLDSGLRRLRLTSLLCQAIVKRRLKTLPPFPLPSTSNVASRLDEVMDILKALPEGFGSLAMAFYDLDPETIDSLMDDSFFKAFAASELLLEPWSGEKDEFTNWAAKFQVEIKKS